MDAHELTERYVEVWNEPDPVRRRKTIEELWAMQGVHLLQAPAAIAEPAANLGFGSFALEARGHVALERRVRRSHEEFVSSGNFRFRSRGDTSQVDHVVKFTWEMVSAERDEVAAVGLEILVLDPEDRIAADYQFIER